MAMVVVRRRGVLTLWQSETDASEQYAISPELLAPSENVLVMLLQLQTSQLHMVIMITGILGMVNKLLILANHPLKSRSGV